MRWADFLFALRENGVTQAAFHSIIDSHCNKNMRMFSSLDPMITCDDLRQEVLLRIWTAVDSDDVNPCHPHVKQLLHQMADQVALDLRRRLAAKGRGGKHRRVPFDVQRTTLPDDSGMQADLTDFLRSSLASDELDVLLLRAEGCRLREIADRLDVSPSEAGRRVVLLKNKLKDLFPWFFEKGAG